MKKGDSAPRLVGRGFFLVLAVLGLSVPGCSEPNRQEQLERVLSLDPAFADALDLHRLLVARAQAFERELDLKRLMVEQTVNQLRQDVAATELEIRRKQAKLREELFPLRAQLEGDLSQTRQELRQRELERTHISKMLTRLQKSLTSGAAQSVEQIAKVAESDQARQAMRRLEMEIQGFRDHERLVILKLALIEL